MQKGMDHSDKARFRLLIAHINDTHSHFDPSSKSLILNAHKPAIPVQVGGFARLKSAIKYYKDYAQSQNMGFLALHAGDCFQGTLYFSQFKGLANADMLNRLELDAMTLGNHEFDLGNERLSDFAQHVNFPLLAANMDLSNTLPESPQSLTQHDHLLTYDTEQGLGRYLVKEFFGVQVAVMGITLEAMHSISNPDKRTLFHNPASTLSGMIEDARSRGIHHIVVLSHLGYEADRRLAKEHEGVAIIVGGHTHQLLGDFRDLGLAYSGEYAEVIEGTAVVQAGCNAEALGIVEITFEADGRIHSLCGGNRLLLDETDCQVTEEQSSDPRFLMIPADKVLEQRLAQHYRPTAQGLYRRQVAVIKEPLRHVRVPDVQGASEICPNVAKALYWQVEQLGFPVDVALHNAGGTRTSLQAGLISEADVIGKLLPFALNIGLRTLSGMHLRDALEGAVDVALANGAQQGGSFPYTYGLRYHVDFNAQFGSRLYSLEVMHKGRFMPVQSHKLYHLVTNAYTGSGKEGYEALRQGSEWFEVEIALAEAFINYAREYKFIYKADNWVQYQLGLSSGETEVD